jgi:MFS superfamily sulfate permease-like transporter
LIFSKLCLGTLFLSFYVLFLGTISFCYIGLLVLVVLLHTNRLCQELPSAHQLLAFSSCVSVLVNWGDLCMHRGIFTKHLKQIFLKIKRSTTFFCVVFYLFKFLRRKKQNPLLFFLKIFTYTSK